MENFVFCAVVVIRIYHKLYTVSKISQIFYKKEENEALMLLNILYKKDSVTETRRRHFKK